MTPLSLDERDIDSIRGTNEELDITEVTEVYLPLSRLINLHVTASQGLFRATDTFLGQPATKVPYVLGIAGSVAVGKSTTARLMQALLSRWPDHPNVALVTTDNFLYPNRELERRGLMMRKGFPESYDRQRLLDFLFAVKSGARETRTPIYSHIRYDIVPDEHQTIVDPNLVIVEGINVLQPPRLSSGGSHMVVSDFFDLSIYVDAPEHLIENWYVERFFELRKTIFGDPESYFQQYAAMTDREAQATAHEIWRTINGKNLSQNILPTRERADVIMEKGEDHRVSRVLLRRL